MTNLLFGSNVENAARMHASECWPEESCGIVTNGIYVPRKNIAKNKLDSFKIKEYPRKGLQAVIHSHPKNHPAPSRHDMQSQIDTAVPWGIVSTSKDNTRPIEWFGDQIKTRAPLLKRNFLHGIRDCYELCRDFYWIDKGLKLPQFPRDDEWWNKGEDILNPANFEKFNFDIISINEAEPGDAALMSIGAPVINHCTVLLQNGLILHHLYNRYSRREPITPWMKFVRYVVRPRL